MSMNKTLIEKILLFLAGNGTGAFAVWMILKKKYDKELDKEVQQIRESIEKGYEEGHKKEELPFDPDEEEEDMELPKEVAEKIVKASNDSKNKEDLNKIVERHGYVNYSKPNEEPTRNQVPEDFEEFVPEEDEIEIIAPEEYGELSDYDQETLYYLRDKILVDTQGHVIENIGGYIGHDALNEFGAYGEADSVYVRNHHNQMDVAIYLRDETLRDFSK